MLPGNYEPEDIEFWLEPPLLLSIQSDVHELLKKGIDAKAMEVVSELRKALESRNLIKTIPTTSKPINAYAIDSSYPTPPLELVGGILTVLTVGYVGYLNGSYDKFVTGEVVFEDVGEFEHVITRRTQVRERELAIKLLKEKAGGKKGIDLVILDGEIPIHPLPYNLPASGGVLVHVAKVLNNLLTLSVKTSTPIVGVVKRVRSKFLSILLGKCLEVNDKLLASLVLNNGEYFVLGSYSDILPQWVRINYEDCELKRNCEGKDCEGIKALMSKRLREGLENLDRVFNGVGYEGLRWLKDVQVVFYRPRNGAPAVKLEVLNPGGVLSIEDVVAYLESQTTDTGYPFLLDRVDEYVRVDARILDYVRNLMINGSKDLNAALMTMLQLTNPQKAYLVKRLEA
nr:MAG: single-stranded DNA endonuclease [Vulcanisaeta sp. AZ3]